MALRDKQNVFFGALGAASIPSYDIPQSYKG